MVSGRRGKPVRQICGIERTRTPILYRTRMLVLPKAPANDQGRQLVLLPALSADSLAALLMRLFRVLALVTDAFGSHGGISKFNRDLLTAVCAHSRCAEVVAVPRLMPEPPGPLPDKLVWRTEGTGGKLKFAAAVLKLARDKLRSAAPAPSTLHAQASTGFDWILCGHINLLPAAFLARRFIRGGSRRARGRLLSAHRFVHPRPRGLAAASERPRPAAAGSSRRVCLRQ